MAKRTKGKRYPIEISGVAWLDLLGYGTMLRPIKFSPSHPDAQKAVHRLKEFQRTAAEASTTHLHAMIINDGVAYVRELSPRSCGVSYDFLHRVYDAFHTVNAIDKRAGYPGARMVVAVGPRLRIGGVIKPRPGHLTSILKRVADGVTSVDQAIHEAFRSAPVTGSVPQLQANFAFTKAYLADQAGGKAGFLGPNCFVDATLFEMSPPKWLSVTRSIDWSTEGMSGPFYQVDAIDNDAAIRLRHEGIRDALQIAKALNVTY